MKTLDENEQNTDHFQNHSGTEDSQQRYSSLPSFVIENRFVTRITSIKLLLCGAGPGTPTENGE
jgi:hypothetical protein